MTVVYRPRITWGKATMTIVGLTDYQVGFDKVAPYRLVARYASVDAVEHGLDGMVSFRVGDGVWQLAFYDEFPEDKRQFQGVDWRSLADAEGEVSRLFASASQRGLEFMQRLHEAMESP